MGRDPSRKQFITAFILTLVFLAAGFLLLETGLVGYGSSFFVFLPFVIGYVLGDATIKAVSRWGLIAALAVFIFV
ncbi:MAG: hypothetical protein P8X57_05240 [Cyclobacteriaceae bacterium]